MSAISFLSQFDLKVYSIYTGADGRKSLSSARRRISRVQILDVWLSFG